MENLTETNTNQIIQEIVLEGLFYYNNPQLLPGCDAEEFTKDVLYNTVVDYIISSLANIDIEADTDELKEILNGYIQSGVAGINPIY